MRLEPQLEQKPRFAIVLNLHTFGSGSQVTELSVKPANVSKGAPETFWHCLQWQ